MVIQGEGRAPGTFGSIEDLRVRGRARVPPFVMDFVDGGAGREDAVARNMNALREITLLPRPLLLSSPPTLAHEILGLRYAAPFGVAPLGLADLVWPGADRGLAEAASRRDIPYVAASASSLTIEQIVSGHCPKPWLQMYVGSDDGFLRAMLAKASALQLDVLMLTVDAPMPGRRLRDYRNRLELPFRLNFRTLLSCLGHPSWLAATVKSGGPRFANYGVARVDGRLPMAAWMASQSRALDWGAIDRLRSSWKGKLVLKGILHPEDAARAVELGIDGIVVSNHGGRQLDASPAPVSLLPAIRQVTRGKIAIVMDGGVRSGEDIARALVAGADFVLVGRAFLYGVAAVGPEHGPGIAMDLLKAELQTAFTLLGIGSPPEASSRFQWERP